MGLCTGETKRRRPFKTIIIPRGIINPFENNVIEIPLNLDATSNLIVKAPSDANPCFTVEPYSGHLADIPSYSTDTSPSSYQNENRYVTRLPDSVSATSAPRSPTRNETTYFPDTTVNRNNDTRENSIRPTVKIDASCQVLPPCAQPVVLQVPCRPQPTFQAPDAHSPLCPICARASCKFFSNLATNRPPCARYNQYPSIFGASQLYPYNMYNRNYPPASCYNPLESPCLRSPILPTSRSEIFSKSREQDENTLLSKILNDKIEKILKPVLLSLVKINPDDEESEIAQRNLACPPTCSYTHLPYKYSREQFYPRRTSSPSSDFYDSRTRPTTSYDSTYSRRSCVAEPENYEDFKSGVRRRGYDSDFSTSRKSFFPKRSNVVITGGNMINPPLGNIGNDFDDYARHCVRKRNSQPFICPSTASCQKRANVSFGEQSDRGSELKTRDSRHSEKSLDLLNTAFIASSDHSFLHDP